MDIGDLLKNIGSDEPSGILEQLKKKVEENNQRRIKMLADIREKSKDMFQRFEVQARWGTKWCEDKLRGHCKECPDQLACAVLKQSLGASELKEQLDELKKIIMLLTLKQQIVDEVCQCPECTKKREQKG